MGEEKKHKCFKIFSIFLPKVPVTQNASVGEKASPCPQEPLGFSNFILFSYILNFLQAPLPELVKISAKNFKEFDIFREKTWFNPFYFGA